MPWKCGAVSTLEMWKGFLCRGSAKGCTKLVGCIEYHKRSYTMVDRGVGLSWMVAKRTIKDSYAMEVWRSSYRVEVWKVVSSWLATLSTIKGSNAMEVQRVVPSWLASFSTIKDFYAVLAWSSSYTTKVWKWFLRHGSVEGHIELVGYIVYHKGSNAVEAQRVVSSWLDALSTINWLHRVA